VYKDPDNVNDVELRLHWAGHVIWTPEERIPRKVMMGRLEGVRQIGRPRKRWTDGVQTDVKELLQVKTGKRGSWTGGT
jgi:hypothetical protein